MTTAQLQQINKSPTAPKIIKSDFGKQFCQQFYHYLPLLLALFRYKQIPRYAVLGARVHASVSNSTRAP